MNSVMCVLGYIWSGCAALFLVYAVGVVVRDCRRIRTEREGGNAEVINIDDLYRNFDSDGRDFEVGNDTLEFF